MEVEGVSCSLKGYTLEHAPFFTDYHIYLMQGGSFNDSLIEGVGVKQICSLCLCVVVIVIVFCFFFARLIQREARIAKNEISVSACQLIKRWYQMLIYLASCQYNLNGSCSLICHARDCALA